MRACVTYKSNHGPYDLADPVQAILISEDAVRQTLFTDCEVSQLQQLNVLVAAIDSLMGKTWSATTYNGICNHYGS